MFYLYTILRMSTYLHFHENVGIHINVLNGFKKAMVIFFLFYSTKEIMIFLNKKLKCLFFVFVFYYYLCKKYYKPIIVKRYTANCVSWVLVLSPCSCVWICATLWTIASQAPLSRGFSRQEYWSGLPCLQGISLTQGWNPSLLRLLRWQAGSLLLAHLD